MDLDWRNVKEKADSKGETWVWTLQVSLDGGWSKDRKGNQNKKKMGIHLTWQIKILPRTGPLPKNIICMTQRWIIKSVHCMKLGSFLTFSIKAP